MNINLTQFSSSINLLCNCGYEVESIDYFFLHCTLFTNERSTLFSTLHNLHSKLFDNTDSLLTNILLIRKEFFSFFSLWVFFHKRSQIKELQDKREGISLTLHYHFHQLHRHLDISRTITAERSPLHIASSRTQTGSLCALNKYQTTAILNGISMEFI